MWTTDPLAMKIRWKLKKHGVAAEDIMSVFSVEKPVCELLPLEEEQRQAPQVHRKFVLDSWIPRFLNQ